MESINDVAFGGLDEHGESIISAEEEERSEQVMYGDLVLSIAPKENKVERLTPSVYTLSDGIKLANTLLASSLFSPSFFLAERIELGLLPVNGKTVLELGAGAALPSLLLSTLLKAQAPSLIVATDYPDATILGNLKANAERNARYKRGGPGGPGVDVIVEGYKWGDDPKHVLRHLRPDNTGTARQGFDILILCDLLHFDQSHPEIILSIKYMLKRAAGARVYVIAGKYTRREICESFLGHARRTIGLVWDELKYEGSNVHEHGPDDGVLPSMDTGIGRSTIVHRWGGVVPVRVGKTLMTDEDLVERRENCWGWVGRWCEEKLDDDVDEYSP